MTISLEGSWFCLTLSIASMEWNEHWDGALDGARFYSIDTRYMQYGIVDAPHDDRSAGLQDYAQDPLAYRVHAPSS
jgi:hypothetical protein